MKTISELLGMAQDAQKQAQERKQAPEDAEQAERLQAQADAQNARQERARDGLPDCPVCKNKRVIYVAQRGKICVKPCECRLHSAQASASGMMRAKLEKFSFNSFTADHEWQARLKRLAVTWARHETLKMLVISGQSGCGKTHISACAARARLKTCGSAERMEFFYWIRDIRELKSLQINDYPAFTDRMEKLKTCQMLLIDGLFDSRQSEADITLIDEILYFRAFSENAGTVINTRLDLRRMAAQVPGVFARLQACAQGYMVNIKRSADRNYNACACIEF